MKKIKILQVIPFFVPAWGFGGPVKVCLDISEKLVENGYDITVATTDAYDNSKRISKLHEIIDGIKVLRFKNISPYCAKEFNLYTPIGFRNYIKNNIKKFDILHLHAFFTYQNIIASKYCVKHNVPYIVHLHESPVPVKIRGKYHFKALFNYFFGYKILQRADKIFVLTTNEKIELEKYLPSLKNKIIIVPNALPETKKNIKVEEKNIIRKKYQFNSSDKIILSLSRLSYLKGIDLLIRSFYHLSKKDKNYKLIIAGPDEGGRLIILRNMVNNLKLQKKIYFMGLVEGIQKEEMFTISDVFALFSRYEPFAITVLEALNYDLPVCLSKNVGVASELSRYDCGLIVNNTDKSTESSRIMEAVYNGKDVYSKNCINALINFQSNKIVGKIEKIYKQILNKQLI